MTDIEMLKPMKHIGTQTIVTQRLILRQFNIDDAEDVFRWASNPEVVRYLSYQPHKNSDETKLILKSWIKEYKNPTYYNWAIVYNNIVIGNISVVSQDNECFSCHLGWQIDAVYWNKGIMTEAAKAVIDYLFDKIGYDRISSGHDTRNIGSGRVMQKAGMTLEGTFRRYCYQKDGSIGDKNYWAIIKSDWKKAGNIMNKDTDFKYTLRNCTYEDINFIFKLKKTCMKWYIEKIYGWSDETQKIKTTNEVERNINDIKIIQVNNKDIGVTTFEKGDDYRIGLTIILPDYQNKGIGASVISDYISNAKADKKRIIIKVFKENPARRLYERLGFSIYNKDSTHYYLEIKF